jgi:ABC-type polysaccharide/polyol phosphate transport system ATPase subunit
MNPKIEVQHASLQFRIFRDPTPTLKDAVINRLSRRKKLVASSRFFALKDINLTIQGGERLGVIGLNGAGKTTLLKMIVGIYTPFSGRVEIHGQVTPMLEIGTGFDVELSGRENIFINGGILGYSRQAMKAREQAIIDFSELDEFIDLPVKYYSSGMYGRLAFSIATMIEPQILLVDEIFSAGDAHFVKKGTQRMLELFNTSQVVVYVSHSLDQIRDLCNRVIVLHKGEIVNQGHPSDMIDYYLSQIVNTSA